ncbi:MAG: hypothetical protein OEW89_07920 [Gammaproteobacteria bacterium]|nr:hypothetical protein [Gammaproteobacteria bacterium]MDH5594994.1 hypothetical protein [Gammaproteobacteria bacterium]MDH5613978.1 hypothetical protein [Gammaproteobacteria bacterium]
MKTIIKLHDRSVHVSISQKAINAFASNDKPLVAEIDLIFGCMVVKRVWFKEVIPDDAIKVIDNLFVCFRSVRYAKSCRIADIDNGAIPEEFPIVPEKRRFVPDWLNIEYKKGKLVGMFGYDRCLQVPDESAVPVFE